MQLAWLVNWFQQPAILDDDHWSDVESDFNIRPFKPNVRRKDFCSCSCSPLPPRSFPNIPATDKHLISLKSHVPHDQSRERCEQSACTRHTAACHKHAHANHICRPLPGWPPRASPRLHVGASSGTLGGLMRPCGVLSEVQKLV